MNKKTVLVLTFVLVLFSAEAFSQTPSTLPRVQPILQDNDVDAPEFFLIGDVTGNIGEAKAIVLTKPVYPTEAKEAGAEGKVKVQIEIDENGGVSSAKAVSGHQLLYEAAQNAALKSKFLTPKVNDQRVKIAGYLNYNFLIETPNWFKVGYDLALGGRVPGSGFSQTAVIKKAFQPDWKTESELILKLAEIIRANPYKNQPLLVNRTIENSVGSNSVAQRGEIRLNIPPPNYESIPVVQNLISALRARLGDDQKSLWQFNLGIAVIESQGLFRNPSTRHESLAVLRRFVQTAPADLQSEFLPNLQNLINLLEQKPSLQSGTEIRKSIINLQKISTK